jgi:hypothetical protein
METRLRALRVENPAAKIAALCLSLIGRTPQETPA